MSEGLLRVTSRDQLAENMILKLHVTVGFSGEDFSVIWLRVVSLNEETVILEDIETSYRAVQMEELIEDLLNPGEFGFKIYTVV